MERKANLYKMLHRELQDYGRGGVHLKDVISIFIEVIQPKTILDYGCGKGDLVSALKAEYPEIDVVGYDPAVPEFSSLPVSKADLVINTDVLEHIPEDELPETIERISNISDCCFFALCHRKATHILATGENAHCTVKCAKWYHKLFRKFFSTIISLPSVDWDSSVVITFSIDDSIKEKYLSIIREKQKNLAIEKYGRMRGRIILLIKQVIYKFKVG